MNASWIPLECTACDETWEATPESLPEPDGEFDCPYCGVRSSVKSFLKTEEGLRVLEAFQGRQR